MREGSKPRRRPMSRFNDRAKRVLGMAGSEATRLHRDIIEPEHVLLGLLTCGGIPAKVLEDSGVKLDEARRAVEAMTGHGDDSGSVRQNRALGKAATRSPNSSRSTPPRDSQHTSLTLLRTAARTAVRTTSSYSGFLAAGFRSCSERLSAKAE